MKRAVLVACLLVFVTVAPLMAQLAVFDPLNYAEAIEQLLQLQQQYTQLVQTYQQIRSQYQWMLKMAQRVPVDMISRYRVPPLPWRTPGTTDIYGTSGGWVNGLIAGDAIGTGFRQATQALHEYGTAFALLPADEISRIKTNYGTVELYDSAAIHAIHGIGAVRQNGKQLLLNLANLEQDAFATGDDQNTLIANLNKANAFAALEARAQEATNQVLVSMLEERLVEGKRQRDAEVNALNAHIVFTQQARDLYDSTSRGTAEAIASFRLP
jgi:hypothetical protein